MKKFIVFISALMSVLCVAFMAVGCNTPVCAKVYSGVDTPESSKYYNNGDLYLDEDDAVMYKYVDGAWVVVSNLKGENGTNGENGANGLNGVGISNITITYEHDDYGQEYVVYTFHYDNDTEQAVKVLLPQRGFAENGEDFIAEIANAQNGDTIHLTNDIVLAQGVVINKDITIELNGYSVSAPEDAVGDGVFHVVSGGKLTINGEGTIDGVNATEYAMAIWVDGGEAIINGGTYTNLNVSGTDTQYDLMYVKNGGKLTINGGTFVCKTPKWTLNNHDTKGGVIEVKGGTFVCYNPAKAESENPVANFVADGYNAVEYIEANGAWRTVVCEIAD